MHPAIIPAAMVLAIASMMAGVVLLRSEKTQLHWHLVALLVAIVVWTTGSLLRFSATSEAGLEASLWFLFAGVLWAPPLWLLLAVHYARLPVIGSQRAARIAVLAPSALTCLALLTNDLHGWVLREVSFETLEGGGAAWAGPLFWVFIGWAYLCVLAGAGAYLVSARRLVFGAERSRGMLLALASLFPIVGSAVYLFQPLPVAFDLTPSTLTISLLLLYVAVFRFQLLEGLPLARRDVIEHLREGVVIAASDGAVVDLNVAAEALLERDAAALRGEPLGHVLASLAEPAGAGEMLDALERLPTDGARVFEATTPADRCIEVCVAGVCDTDGSLVGGFAVLRDRTDERRFEALVRRAQKLETVGTLASGIAHEVNNPLAFIQANLTQILEMGDRVDEVRASRSDPGGSDPGGSDPGGSDPGGSDPKLAEDLADLRQIAEETLDGVARIERIVSGMRRMTAGRAQAFEVVDLESVCADALRLSNLQRDARVKIHTRLAPDLPCMDGLPERLVQMLLNLLVNARQALGSEGGEIGIEATADDDHIEILVSDDGPGIPVEIQERIFDPFFTTKDPDQGTGLGLAIACDVARDHGGILDVHSRPGEGAHFIARLPARQR